MELLGAMNLLVTVAMPVATLILGFTFGYFMSAKGMKDSVKAGMHIGMELGANAVASQYLQPSPETTTQENETESKAMTYGFDLTTPKGK